MTAGTNWAEAKVSFLPFVLGGFTQLHGHILIFVAERGCEDFSSEKV